MWIFFYCNNVRAKSQDITLLMVTDTTGTLTNDKCNDNALKFKLFYIIYIIINLYNYIS